MKKGKYSIERAIYVDRNITPTLRGHIPYHLCTVLVGPKGGRYVLDGFCTEYMIKCAINRFGLSLEPQGVIRRLVSQKLIGYTATDLKNNDASSDQLVREVANQLKAKPLIRLEGKVVLDNAILQNFYADDLKALQ